MYKAETENVETIDSKYVFFKIEHSIVHFIYKRGITIDLEAAKDIARARRAFLKGRSYPSIADVRFIKLATSDARKFLMKEATYEPAISGVTAIALLVSSRLTVIMANLFAKIVKQTVPTKLFMTQEQAMKWLEQFLDKSRE